MTDEFEYHMGRKPDRTYVSRPFSERGAPDKRILYKVFDGSQVRVEEASREIILREDQDGRVEIRAYIYDDNQGIDRITIVRFIGGHPTKVHFTLRGEDLRRWSALLQAVRARPLEPESKNRFDDAELADLMTEDGVRHLIERHPEILRQVVENDLTETDVVGLAYRKRQLEVFNTLLHDGDAFQERMREREKARSEDVWQEFFEQNTWIFGYGLQYIFASSFETVGRQTLRQMVSGSRVGQRAKETDAFLRTRGLISSVCLVEIKRHDQELLAKTPYRSDCWQVSGELAGAVAQAQKTAQRAVEEIGHDFSVDDRDGFPTGERAYLYNPKSFIVIGTLSEFQRDGQISREKFASFELFRRNLINPEIITFDELLERANHIVEHTKTADSPSNLAPTRDASAPANEWSEATFHESDQAGVVGFYDDAPSNDGGDVPF